MSDTLFFKKTNNVGGKGDIYYQQAQRAGSREK